SQTVEETLTSQEVAPAGAALPLPPDPFIDAVEEEATVYYLRRVVAALGAHEAAIEDLPDPAVFRRACAYYQVEGVEQPGRPREVPRRGYPPCSTTSTRTAAKPPPGASRSWCPRPSRARRRNRPPHRRNPPPNARPAHSPPARPLADDRQMK